MEGLDIKDVISSKCIKKYKTGYWKAQFNLLKSDRYMVEVYWFPYYLEGENNKSWFGIYNNKSDAEKIYQDINIKRLRRILK